MFKQFKKIIMAIKDLDSPESLLLILNQLQDSIQTSLAPLSSKVQNDSTILTNVQLTTGDNVISHTLNRKLAGWSIVRLRGAATVYDKQDTNQSPNLTLLLNSSASVVVDILVY